MEAVEVPQTLEYKGGQLNVAPVLEVESPYILMAAGQRKPEIQWTPEERKAAIIDQRLKSLILSVLLNDQINSVINYLTAKSTWDVLLLFHEGPSDVKNSREFQDNLDDEEDTRSSHEYLDDLWRDYQAELFSQA
ncbi:hypothetical protein Tco_0319847 [Tanacetum coccineum]